MKSQERCPHFRGVLGERFHCIYLRISSLLGLDRWSRGYHVSSSFVLQLRQQQRRSPPAAGDPTWRLVDGNLS